jgi:hypothetical protein
MGIDLHLGNHFLSFHLPALALMALAVFALYAAWKLYLIVLSAMRG